MTLPAVTRRGAGSTPNLLAPGTRQEFAYRRGDERQQVVMEYKLLGRSGLKVPVLSFGTGTIGGVGDMFSK